jgi:release factor glutamine methyltransferase
MNIKQALQYASKKIDRNDAEILLAHAINKSRAFIIAHSEYKLNPSQKRKFKKHIKKRKENSPVAYIIGYKEFYNLDFKLNNYTLVPRPETELITDETIKKIKERRIDLLLDIGTGSGCIPISILKNIDNQIKTIATDISKKTLKVAKQNAKKHNVNIDFRQGNLLEPIKKEVLEAKNIIITANLPYITEEQFNSEPSIKKEPKQALIAENEGLKYYKKLIEQLTNIDIEEKNITLIFEIDPSQSEKIKGIILKYLPNPNIEIKKDLKKSDRLVEILV